MVCSGGPGGHLANHFIVGPMPAMWDDLAPEAAMPSCSATFPCCVGNAHPVPRGDGPTGSLHGAGTARLQHKRRPKCPLGHRVPIYGQHSGDAWLREIGFESTLMSAGDNLDGFDSRGLAAFWWCFVLPEALLETLMAGLPTDFTSLPMSQLNPCFHMSTALSKALHWIRQGCFDNTARLAVLYFRPHIGRPALHTILPTGCRVLKVMQDLYHPTDPSIT